MIERPHSPLNLRRPATDLSAADEALPWERDGDELMLLDELEEDDEAPDASDEGVDDLL